MNTFALWSEWNIAYIVFRGTKITDTEFGENPTSRFQVMVEQTNRQTDKRTNRQTDTKTENYLNLLSFVWNR